MKPKNHMKGGQVRPLSKAAIIVTALAAAVAQQLEAGPSPGAVNSLLRELKQAPPTAKSAVSAYCQEQVWREAPAGQGWWVSFPTTVNARCKSAASARDTSLASLLPEGAPAVAGKAVARRETEPNLKAHGSKP